MFEQMKCGDRQLTKCVLDTQAVSELLRMIVATNESVVRINEVLVRTLKEVPSDVGK